MSSKFCEANGYMHDLEWTIVSFYNRGCSISTLLVLECSPHAGFKEASTYVGLTCGRI
jgi:hypothetical protein